MTVVMDTSTDKLMQNPESRKLIKDLMLETQQGAAACGVAIESEFIEKMLTYTDSMVPYAPSMKLDYDAKRPMEIKGIYSNPLKAALKGGADLKKIRMLEQQLYFKQSEYLK